MTTDTGTDIRDLRCPHCAAPVSVEDNGGNNLADLVTGIYGEQIEFLYFCCCFHCWKKFDVLNGVVRHVILMPNAKKVIGIGRAKGKAQS